MPELDAVIRELAGPLRAEGRTGHRDTTIIGTSIGDYARGWAARAAAADLTDGQRAQCAQIAAALADYGRQDPPTRSQAAAEAQRLLSRLAASGGSEAPPSAPAPRPRPARQ